MRTYEGSLDGRHLRIAVVASRFNQTIVGQLVEGALDCLRRHGVDEQDTSLTWVPGAFELGSTAHRIAASGEIDAVLCLGAVIRGETPHFEHVAEEAAHGVAAAAQATGVPVIFGVLTTNDIDQAADRAGGKAGNKGFDAAIAAIEMANLYAALPKPATEL